MEIFKVIKPSPTLAPYIKYYWILRINAATPVTERVLPVGCVHLTFHKGKQLFSPTENSMQPRAFICGQASSFFDVISTGNIEMISVVFQPYAAKAFFPMPISDFHGKNVSIDELGSNELADLEKQITDNSDDTRCIELIESFLIKKLYLFPEYNLKRIKATVQEINLQAQVSTPQLSDIACLSSKQFNRIFTDYIGATPKEFVRIIRMQRALYTLQTNFNENFAQLACECGYYDQSHLIKEFKTFSGYTPSEYLSVCAPYSDYFSTF
ncbi:MAG: transcriptional activator FtrA [Bacteroidetes bacterium]|jgi:AraC-like DNA-binding protein|nr:transcriptional activator FtrA [Bacteroidota bacterium]